MCSHDPRRHAIKQVSVITQQSHEHTEVKVPQQDTVLQGKQMCEHSRFVAEVDCTVQSQKARQARGKMYLKNYISTRSARVHCAGLADKIRMHGVETVTWMVWVWLAFTTGQNKIKMMIGHL